MNENKKRRNPLFFLWSAIFILMSGIFLGFYYSSLPENNPQRDKKSCESVYGKWLGGESRCLLSYKKFGETCVDGGQCISGICSPPNLTREQRAELLRGPLANITGICSANPEPVGCVPQVLGGVVSVESMCLED